MIFEEALTALQALADPVQAIEMARYHKVERVYLGVRVPQIDELAKGWRERVTPDQRLAVAQGLWDSNIHEGRVAATKLMTQARIKDDGAAWAMMAGWVPDFDAWAIADHACNAAAKRLVADPGRIDEVEGWTRSDHMWTRRAALVITLPWTKQNFPKVLDLEIRDRVLGWAAGYVADKEWFIQKSIAWWLRELSRHDAPRVVAFLDQHGADMKRFAREEAGRLVGWVMRPSPTDDDGQIAHPTDISSTLADP
jgi:3-methyladenine DNA glycosylase AlkD